MLRKSNTHSLAPRSATGRRSRDSGVHIKAPARAKARKIRAALSWIARLEPLEVVLLTDFNCDWLEDKPPVSNTVHIGFTLKNCRPVPEPPEHWRCWPELRERLPRRDWHKAERLLRQLALDVAAVLSSGKTLVAAKLQRELVL
jgi:hypothetical protein